MRRVAWRPCAAASVETVGRAIQAARYLLMSRAWTDAIAEEVGAFDVWQAESVITLGQAVALRDRFGGRIVYDANDIDSEAGRMARLPGPWKQLLRRHERRLARAADAVVTVSDPYASILARILERPVDAVVRNAAMVVDREAEPTPADVVRGSGLSERLGLPPERRIVLYLGQVMHGRGLRELFLAIALVDEADLVVAGFGPRLRALSLAGRLAAAEGSGPLPRRRDACRDPRVDRLCGRRRDARPARHAQSPPEHADEALRRDGRRRPGRRERPARDRPDRRPGRLRRPLRPDRSR